MRSPKPNLVFSPLFTSLTTVYAPIKVQKSPKSTSEGIKAVQSLVNEFGLQGVAVRELIDFAKSQLAETNPAVRTACVQLFGTLRVFFGADVRAFVKDVPPAQLATIDAEFDRVAKDEKPAVTREQNFDIGHSAQSSMEELFPRVDISVQISSAIVEV